MKTNLLKILILFSVVFSFVSCNDPIFFIVHEEIPVLKPKIDGSPTNFAAYNNKLYVASGKKIYQYAGIWNEWIKLNDFVVSLAATDGTDGNLYALCLVNNTGVIRRFDAGIFVNLPIPLNVQSIYSSGKKLFFSVRDNNNVYSIYYIDEAVSLSAYKKINGADSDFMLKGAVSGTVAGSTNYFLCLYSGILCVEESKIDTYTSEDKPKVLTPAPNYGNGGGFNGIIKLNDDYSAVITSNGDLYQINCQTDPVTITPMATFTDKRYTTGAIALWYKYSTDPKPSLLLVGRTEKQYSTSTGYSNGYVEIELDTVTGGIKSGALFIDPGKNLYLSSIDNYERYVSTLGKKPVNHIIQTPASIDPNMTMFASTQQNGVWSYRNRNNGLQWNAEQ